MIVSSIGGKYCFINFIENDDEYEDIRFKTFFYEHRIKIERIVLGMPKHNG